MYNDLTSIYISIFRLILQKKIRRLNQGWYLNKEGTKKYLDIKWRERERESLDKALFHRRNLLIKSRNLSRQRLMSTFYSGAARALEHDEIDYAGAGRSFATSWWISYAGKQDFCPGITLFSLFIYILFLYIFLYFFVTSVEKDDFFVWELKDSKFKICEI